MDTLTQVIPPRATSRKLGIELEKALALVEAGLLPLPMIGDGVVGWFAPEIEAIQSARNDGASDEDLRFLVKKIEAARRSGPPWVEVV